MSWKDLKVDEIAVLKSIQSLVLHDDRVLVKPTTHNKEQIEEEYKVDGKALKMPDYIEDSHENPFMNSISEVVSLGKGKVLDNGTRIPFTVQVGDIVLYEPYNTKSVVIEDEVYHILRESDIAMILDDFKKDE